jgi:hypothetical protein
MSDLVPSMLALDKGLDLQTAKMTTPPGSLLDTLNYEQVDFQGQKRIDGYARYDGTVLPAFDEYYVVDFEPSGCWTGFPEDTNTPLEVNGKMWATAIKNANLDGDSAYIQIVNHALEVKVGDSIAVLGGAGIGAITAITPGKVYTPTPESHYEKLLELMAVMRPRITVLPEPVAGLHWFRDRLYAVAGVVRFSGGTATPLINATVAIGDAQVFDRYTGIVVEDDSDSLTILTAYNVKPGDILYDPQTGQELTLGTRLPPTTASFYESRTDEQAYAEDGAGALGGWIAKHNGWRVKFKRGIALYGELAALNQNRQNVGIQGPTSIDGTNGSPAILSQNVALTNGPAQVNGWKSHDSPTAYVLDARDVQLDDSAYVYADAYIQWTANTATVTTPGSDMAGLAEYPPTNSVVYIPF